MTDLIARLESAEEGSRELDEAIFDHIGRKHGTGLAGYTSAPFYTTSLDAALLLVPEGLTWTATGYDPDGGWSDSVDYRLPYAVLAGPMEELPGDHMSPPEPHRDSWEARATTPALALCAAWLKARQHDKS